MHVEVVAVSSSMIQDSDVNAIFLHLLELKLLLLDGGGVG